MKKNPKRFLFEFVTAAKGSFFDDDMVFLDHI